MSEATISKIESTVINLAERVDRHEDRLEAAVNGMSSKLDALVEISRAMATLQERQAQHADGISELKADLKAQRTEHATTVKSLIESHEKSVSRIHERFDKSEGRLSESMKTLTDALASHCRQDDVVHDAAERELTSMRHEWELRHASYEKDQMQQSAQFTADLTALEKRFDAFLNHIEGMKRLGVVLWGVIGSGVLLIAGVLIKFAMTQVS